jgi:DNA-binding transcriptional LysR family regulator
MKLRHLQAFVAVAEEGTFSRAARRLELAQPPLSRYVHELEQELGSELFVRGRSGAALTPAGRLVLERALAVLKTFREIEDFAPSSDATARVLHIGIGWGLWEAFERIRALHASRFPAARITAEDLSLAHDSRDAHPTDLVITRDRVEAPAFEYQSLFEEHFVALISDRHRLASRESITLSELASEPLLLFDRRLEPGIWDRTWALIRLAAARPRIVDGQPPPWALEGMAMIASGDGFYLGTSSPCTQTHRASGVAAVPLRWPRMRLQVRLAWRADAPHAVKEFARSARAAFAMDNRLHWRRAEKAVQTEATGEGG